MQEIVPIPRESLPPQIQQLVEEVYTAISENENFVLLEGTGGKVFGSMNYQSNETIVHVDRNLQARIYTEIQEKLAEQFQTNGGRFKITLSIERSRFSQETRSYNTYLNYTVHRNM